MKEKTSMSRKVPATSRKDKAKLQYARDLNYDLFERIAPVEVVINSADGELPSVAELHQRFELYNELHFGGALPAAEISYSNRLLAAGICYPTEKKIKIGVRYHRLYSFEVYGTLLHEMIHLVNPTHDRRFRATARLVGAPLNARYHPDLRRPPRYLYRCPGCGAEFPRQRRLRESSCGPCSTGGYDSRFKLRLVDSVNRQKRREALETIRLVVA